MRIIPIIALVLAIGAGSSNAYAFGKNKIEREVCTTDTELDLRTCTTTTEKVHKDVLIAREDNKALSEASKLAVEYEIAKLKAEASRNIGNPCGDLPTITSTNRDSELTATLVRVYEMCMMKHVFAGGSAGQGQDLAEVVRAARDGTSNPVAHLGVSNNGVRTAKLKLEAERTRQRWATARSVLGWGMQLYLADRSSGSGTEITFGDNATITQTASNGSAGAAGGAGGGEGPGAPGGSGGVGTINQSFFGNNGTGLLLDSPGSGLTLGGDVNVGDGTLNSGKLGDGFQDADGSLTF